MVVDDCYKIPKIVTIKSGDKLDITDCTDDKTIEVFSLNRDEISSKCTEFSVVQENEKLVLIPPTNNDVEKYLVKYEKLITKEERKESEQELMKLILKGASDVKCSVCGTLTCICAKQSEDKEHYYLYNKCPNCMTESFAFTLAKLE